MRGRDPVSGPGGESGGGAASGRRAPAGARRVFLALPLPAAARRELAGLAQSALAAHAAHLRMVAPVGYHATVHFFGPLAADDLSRAHTLCGQVAEALPAPLPCALTGLAQLPPRGAARVVCAVFGEGHDALAAFLAAARNRIGAAAFAVPARSPLPHVTVARVRHGRHWRMPDRVALAETGIAPADRNTRLGIDLRRLRGHGAAPTRFVLDQLVLFESHLHRAGARYVPLTSRRAAAR